MNFLVCIGTMLETETKSDSPKDEGDVVCLGKSRNRVRNNLHNQVFQDLADSLHGFAGFGSLQLQRGRKHETCNDSDKGCGKGAYQIQNNQRFDFCFSPFFMVCHGSTDKSENKDRSNSFQRPRQTNRPKGKNMPA